MKEKLYYTHIIFLIYMIELDITMFSFSRKVAANLGTNGWLGVIILALIAFVNIFLFYLVYRRGKGESVFTILEKSIHKWILTPFYVGFSLLWISLASFIGKNYILLYQMFSFQTTNSMLLFGVFSILVYYLLSKGIYNIVKATTVFFLLSFWMVFLAFYYIPNWEAVRLTTFFLHNESGGFSLKGWAEVYTLFMGYELCMFLFPYTNKESKLFKGVILGHLLISFVQLIVIIVSMGFFSFPQLKEIAYPVFDLFSYIELPFIARVEVLIYLFFLFSNLISAVMYSFAALVTLERVMPRIKTKFLCIAITLFFFGIGFIPRILREAESLLNHAFFIEMGFAFLSPFILLFLIWIQQKKGRGTKNA